jgi:hypothetical protein
VVCNLCSSGVLEQLWRGTASSLQVSVAARDVRVAACSRAKNSNSRPVIVQLIPVEFAVLFCHVTFHFFYRKTFNTVSLILESSGDLTQM